MKTYLVSIRKIRQFSKPVGMLAKMEICWNTG